MIKIKVEGSVVSVQETQALYCGSQDVYTCSFTFDTSWERFSKSAVFRVNGKTVTVLLDEENGCILPWELLVRSNIGQEIEVGMYGVSADAEILTSVWDSLGAVREGSELGNDAREPSAGVYEQIMANVQRVDEKVDNYNTEVQTQVQRAESAAAVSTDNAERTVENAEKAQSAAASANGAKDLVLGALNNVPAGSTVIVNNLSSGGTSAALSAEMGKELNEKISNRPNPNLFINWYFPKPKAINQRGLESYTGDGYTIDRWKLSNTRITVKLESDGLLATRSNTGTWASFRQYFNDLEAGTYTVSFLVTEVNSATCSLTVYKASNTDTFKSENKLAGSNTTKPGMLSCTFDYTPDASYPYVAFTVGFPSSDAVGVSFKILAAKLERGTQQTLARQDASGNWVLNEIPDYREELAKCQRYALAVGYSLPSGVLTQARTQLRLQIPTPETMRTTPTITEVEITGVRTVNGANITPEVTSSYVDSVTSNGVMFTIETPTFNVDPYVNNTPVNCYIQKMFLDAEL